MKQTIIDTLVSLPGVVMLVSNTWWLCAIGMLYCMLLVAYHLGDTPEFQEGEE